MATVTVRATINLPGLKRGQIADTDPDLPYVANCLKAGYIVIVNGDQPPAEAQYVGQPGDPTEGDDARGSLDSDPVPGDPEAR